jgi:hypothetical protein
MYNRVKKLPITSCFKVALLDSKFDEPSQFTVPGRCRGSSSDANGETGLAFVFSLNFAIAFRYVVGAGITEMH